VFEPIKRQARRHLLGEFLRQKILIEDGWFLFSRTCSGKHPDGAQPGGITLATGVGIIPGGTEIMVAKKNTRRSPHLWEYEEKYPGSISIESLTKVSQQVTHLFLPENSFEVSECPCLQQKDARLTICT
jgi:hypothetical protein